jgi:uncharacterized iron-regulated membrane protein
MRMIVKALCCSMLVFLAIAGVGLWIRRRRDL